jgi:hypothetical protein
MAFEKYILNDEPDPHVNLHLLRALVGEYIEGQITKNQALGAIGQQLDVTLTNDEESDLQAWMVAIDAETTPEEKRSVADETYRVLVITESAPEVTLYDTKAKLRTRLNWI